MKNIFCKFTFTILLYLINFQVIAASFNEKIPLYFKLDNENLLAGQNSLNISLCDTRIKDWCAKPQRNTGVEGQKINEFLTITPEIKGEWRFDSWYNISFIPESNFLANQTYKVTVNTKDFFPSFIDFKSNIINFTTLPLLPTIKEMNYLQDNIDISKRFVQARIAFNYPIDSKTLEERIELIKTSTKEKLPFSITFNQNKTEATIIANIQALTDKEDIVSIELKDGVKPLYGGVDFAHKNVDLQNNKPSNNIKYSYKEQVLIPSLSSYSKVTNVIATIVKDEKLKPQQIIVITTNTPILGEELKKHLELFLLPKDKPAFLGVTNKKDYRWQSPKEVTDDILKSSEKVNFELLPSVPEVSTMHSFKVNTISARSLLVKVNSGIKASGGLMLGSDYAQIVQIPENLREVKLMSDGSILSLSGEKILPVYSLGIDKLYLEIDKINQQEINHLISQTNRYNSFGNPTFINEYSFNEYNISEVFQEEVIINSENLNLPYYTDLDFSKYFNLEANGSYSKGLFLTKVFAKDNQGNIISQDKRLILVTDLGLIVKTDKDGTHNIFVSYISSGKPASGVKVDIIRLNGEVIESQETDSNGHAILSNVKDSSKEKTPVAYLLTTSDDFSFMPYGRVDRQVNYSRFDVSGVVSSDQGLKAYLFSDRGIYRPGEHGHIGIILKQNDWQGKFDGLPLAVEVTNPRGQIIDKGKITLNPEGFTEYLFNTYDESLSGTYNVSLYLVGDKGDNSYLNSISLRVEDFQPDRMKININFNNLKDELWTNPKDLKANVNLINLYGTPAENRKVSGYIDIRPTQFFVPAFKDYKFYSSKENKEFFSERLGDITTDSKGDASFALNLEKYYNATFNLTLSVDGFEPDSGRSVNANKSIIVSPLDYIIGFKSDSDLKYIKRGTTSKIEFIAISNKANKVAVPDLSLNLKKINHVNNLVADGGGNYSYKSVPIETNISSDKIDITAENGYVYDIPTKEAGDYVIYLTDKEGTIFAQSEFSVIGEGNVTANLTEKANLTVKLDHDAYEAGDTILLNIITPYTGYGLITIETDKVHNFTWFKTDENNTIQEIKIPNDFEGKGYVNVQFVRDLDAKEIFMSPFSYAVVPFTSDVHKHNQEIELALPTKIKSGEKLTINYSTTNPGKIVIFAIDEGILSFAGYQTPDPLNYFIGNRALEVTTSQIMDLILPEKSFLMRAMAAPPGDYAMSMSRNLNPFKRKDQPPVVFWSGILDADPDRREITFNIPSYFNGALRVMAVSASLEAAGAFKSDVLVQSDIIITPNLPLFVAPDDEFTVPVTIFNNLKDSGNAQVFVNIETSNGLKILEYPNEIQIDENIEATINVKLKATDKLGSADFKVTASINHLKPDIISLAVVHSSEITTTTSVRPPMPNVTTVDTGFAAGNNITLKIPRDLYPEFAKLQISASKSPLAIISGFRDFLNNYPYGCTEQLISQNFANVLLYDQQNLVTILQTDRKKMDESLSKAFQMLSERQNYDGGFKYWNNVSDSSDPFISVYAMHFLTEAASKYLAVPSDTFNQGIYYLENMANRSISSLNEAREKAYAVYILTRNNVITTSYIANILKYLEEYQQDKWHNDLTAVYLAASYKMLQMNEEADKLLDKFILDKSTTLKSDYLYYSPLIKYSEYLYLISLHFPERLKSFDQKIVEDIANFAKDNYNTLSASYAIIASITYADKINNADENTIKVNYSNQEVILENNKIMQANFVINEAKEIALTSTNNGFFYQLLTSGYDKVLKENKEIVKGIEITKKYLDENNKEVHQVKLGDNVIVKITMRSNSTNALNNMVILDLLPAGFELLPDNNINVLELDKQAMIWRPIYINRRDDRIMIFGTIPNHEMTYQYKIKAINKGIFTLPAIYSESMYDPRTYYRGVIGSIIIE